MYDVIIVHCALIFIKKKKVGGIMLLQFEEAVNTLGGLKKDLTEVRVSL